MPTFALIMLAASIVGFIIAAVLTLTTKISAKQKMLCLAIVFINVLFAALSAWLMYERSFAVDVSMTMKTPCYVLGLMTFICCIIQGAVIKSGTEKLTGKLLIPEILSIAALVYFFIQNRIPL